MGDVVNMPIKDKDKAKGESTEKPETFEEFQAQFSNGLVTIGFNDEWRPSFIVAGLDAAQVNWLCDRLKNYMLNECEDLTGIVLEHSDDDDEDSAE